jgi:hypothetical protein
MSGKDLYRPAAELSMGMMRIPRLPARNDIAIRLSDLFQ